MYDTLRPELITASPHEREYMKRNPTAVVTFDLFSRNQFPYLEVRRPFILGTAENKWKATLSHYFLRVLEDKGLLKRVYTQNIDGLDLQVGLPSDRLVHVHGTIGEYSCEFCGASYPREEFRQAVRSCIRNIYDCADQDAPSESSHILCGTCQR
jgi:NAD-dependent SIR2 family protein deacetylase